MNEIEFKLLQSLRASNLRDDFAKPAAFATSAGGSRNATPTSSSHGSGIGEQRELRLPPRAESAVRVPSAGVELLYGDLTDAVIGAAIQVHRWLGPGQLESTYQRALAKELAYCGIRYHAQVPITSWYRDEPVGEFFADFIVEDKIILELKVVARTLPVHRAQVVSYLRAAGLQLGLILNFQVPVLVMGVKRVSP
jgi:GxxExxY protein